MRIRLTDLGDPQVKEFQEQGPLEKGLSSKQKSDKIFSYDSVFTGRRALIENPREFIGGSCRNRLQEKPDH